MWTDLCIWSIDVTAHWLDSFNLQVRFSELSCGVLETAAAEFTHASYFEADWNSCTKLILQVYTWLGPYVSPSSHGSEAIKNLNTSDLA